MNLAHHIFGGALANDKQAPARNATPSRPKCIFKIARCFLIKKNDLGLAPNKRGVSAVAACIR